MKTLLVALLLAVGLAAPVRAEPILYC